MVVTEDHPLIGARSPGNGHHDVVKRTVLPLERQFHVQLRRARTQVIRHRQRAAPLCRGDGPPQLLKNRQCVTIGNRQHGNLEDGLRIFAAILPAAGFTAPTRRDRIARMDRHVHDAAALRAELRTIRSCRIDVASEVAIVFRVGIDQATDGAVLVRDLGLDATPAGAVARQYDLPFYADAELLQALEVGRHAVVHVNHFARDVAVTGVGVIKRRLVARVRIFRQHRLLELERVLHWRHQLHAGLERPGHHRLELLDASVEAERLELGERPVCHPLRGRLSGDVRVAGHRFHVLLETSGVWELPELLLALPLRGDGVIGEAPKARRLRVRRPQAGDDKGDGNGGNGRETTHG